MQNYETIFENLNPQQKAAVETTDGPILIIAGAGSGKTRVLTNRIALLIHQGVVPQEIMALTFTRKAAEEMRSRIRYLAGEPADHLVMGTFHSVFVRFLREWHEYIGFTQSFTIYDVEDSQNCLKACIGEILFGPNWNDKEAQKKELEELESDEARENRKKERKRLLTVYKVKDVASRISLLKNEYIKPDQYKDMDGLVAADSRKGWEKLPEIYDLYCKRCKASNAMDFDDILIYMNDLMENFPTAKKEMARRFRYILVDEYQDTNTIQYNIIQHLSEKWNNLTVVGDDSQSIYAFRGANINNILNFREDHKDAKLFKLETNYRSTPQIVEAANELIVHNGKRIEKTCNASREPGSEIQVQYLDNDREEARFIGNDIIERHQHGAPYRNHAILYRTNAQSRELEETFLKLHIPYVIFSGISFYQRMEVKDVLAYLRLIVNKDDDESFKRICNKPARGISEATLSTLMARASFHQCSIYNAMTGSIQYPDGLKPKTVKSLQDFHELLERLREKVKGLDAFKAAEIIFDETGILKFYEEEKDEEGFKRINNIKSVLDGISNFIEEQKEDFPDVGETEVEIYHLSLTDYLENIALIANADTKTDDRDRVALMTSHCSKGLEFPVVYIAGCEEGLFPMVKRFSTDAELEEERRLFYVSMTRAKDDLILTLCANRWKYGNREDCEPSRFLEEINPKD